MTDAARQAKRPVTLLAGPYGHPLHPILVTVPIGAWVSSLVFDIASHFAGGAGSLARAAAWLIAIGLIGALAAASIGFLDLFAIPAGTRAFRTGLIHMTVNLSVIVAYAIGLIWRLAQEPFSGPVGAGKIALSVVSLAGLSVAGYLGGKLAYHYGVRVADERTQSEGYREVHPARSTSDPR